MIDGYVEGFDRHLIPLSLERYDVDPGGTSSMSLSEVSVNSSIWSDVSEQVSFPDENSSKLSSIIITSKEYFLEGDKQ